jgi:hypothetical protein
MQLQILIYYFLIKLIFDFIWCIFIFAKDPKHCFFQGIVNTVKKKLTYVINLLIPDSGKGLFVGI